MLAKICLLSFLFLVCATNGSRASLAQEFCQDRYCGSTQSAEVVRGHRFKKIASHKTKTVRRVQVASIGNEPLHEANSASGLVAQAEQYLGQTAHQVGVRSSLWCSAFIRKLSNVAGVDDRAISWLSRPRTSPSIGAIAVMRHHVGIVKGFDSAGNPILISGNHRHRVGIGAYPKSRIIAYVSL